MADFISATHPQMVDLSGRTFVRPALFLQCALAEMMPEVGCWKIVCLALCWP